MCSGATVTAERARQVDFCTPSLEACSRPVTGEELSADIDISASRLRKLTCGTGVAGRGCDAVGIE